MWYKYFLSARYGHPTKEQCETALRRLMTDALPDDCGRIDVAFLLSYIDYLKEEILALSEPDAKPFSGDRAVFLFKCPRCVQPNPSLKSVCDNCGYRLEF